jgi:hypothetical protein
MIPSVLAMIAEGPGVGPPFASIDAEQGGIQGVSRTHALSLPGSAGGERERRKKTIA